MAAMIDYSRSIGGIRCLTKAVRYRGASIKAHDKQGNVTAYIIDFSNRAVFFEYCSLVLNPESKDWHVGWISWMLLSTRPLSMDFLDEKGRPISPGMIEQRLSGVHGS